MSETEKLEVETDDGWRLHGDHHRPDATPLGVVVATHAMMVDRRTMDRPHGAGLVSVLERRGFAVLNFDLRGHGESVNEQRDFDLEEVALHDVPALLAEARRLYPELPLFWLGHSLGSNAALITFGLMPDLAPDAAVSLAPNLWLPSLEPNPIRRALKARILHAWPHLTRPKGEFDPHPLRMGRSRIPLRYTEQFDRWYREDALHSRDGATDYREALRHIRLPLLAISSTGDPLLAHPASTARYLALLSRARLEHRVIGDRPGAPAPSHAGLVVDPRSRPLWEEIGDWLVDRASDLA